MVVALFALVTLPVLRAVQVAPLYEEMRTVTEPSRSLLTRIHAALALEQSLLRDFVERQDSVAVGRYYRAVADERDAYSQLAPLAKRLGPEVDGAFQQLRELERGWHLQIEKNLLENRSQRFTRDPMHAKLYEELLLSAAKLDEGLNAAAASRRAAIEATSRAQVWITFAVGLLALGAAIIVAWIGRRLSSFAVREEAARHDMEEAILSRARLTRGITHDLKNPLQAISGSAEMLEEGIAGPLNPAQLRIVGRIRASGRHLLGLISDLLELSAAEGGTLSVRPVPTSIGALVIETAGEYEQRATAAGLELRTECAEDVPEIVTDPARVRQILQNLISNAVKYTPSGGRVTVTSALRPPPEDHGGAQWVAIDVADTGEGIPPDMIESIFDEFSRLEAHRKVPGAGLGLAIARRVSTLLGGNITLVSSAAGSTFTLWIPQDRRASPSPGVGSSSR